MYHIFHDTEINAKPESIFHMISTSDGLNTWWTVASEGKLDVNEKFRFYFAKDFDWQAKVLEFKTDESLTFQMVKADEDWDNTLLSFEIISVGQNRCKLRFEHRNWAKINDHFRRTSFCWALYLNDMKKHLEKAMADTQ